MRGAVCALLAPVWLAACGPSAAAVVVPTPTAAVPAGLPSGSLPSLPAVHGGAFPEQDTPLASATPSQAQLWARFGVTIIPSRHIFDAVPAPPPVQNNTQGAVSDADARRWAVAFNRANALLAWGDAHGQAVLRQSLLGDAYQGGPAGRAVAAGWSVTWPACSLYSVSLALYPVDARVLRYYSGRGQTTAGGYVFVSAPPQGGCEVTATDSAGARHSLQSIPQTLFVQGGIFRNDPVLGDIWFSDSGGTCDDVGVPPQLCGRS